MKGFAKIFLILLIPLLIAGLWNSIPAIKTAVHFLLDPTFGILISWNPLIGFIIISAIRSFALTIVQKKFTDQKALKELKAALMAADYYDRSDAQVDYFDTAYYYHITVAGVSS